LRLEVRRSFGGSILSVVAWVALAAHAGLSASAQDWKSLYNQGVTAMEADDPRGAALFFERAAALRPNEADVLFGLASAYFRSGRTPQALAKIHKLLSMPGLDFKTLMATGHLLMNSGQLAEASEVLKRAQKFAPPKVEGQSESIYFNNLFAFLFTQLQQNQRALENLQSLVKVEPHDPQVRFRLILMTARTADFGKAYVLAEQALNEFPNDQQIVLAYALTSYFTTHNTAAEAAYGRLIRMEPDSGQPYFARGNFYMDLGRYSDAARDFLIAVAKDPNNYANHYMYGLVLFRLSNISEASLQLKKALELNPADAAAVYQLGLISLRQGKHQEAIEAFEKTIKLEPNYIGAYYELGLLYAREGKKEKSAQMFKIQKELNAKVHKGIIYAEFP
jgi:tetratricopeptide (TPR) repeat protein